MSTSKATAEKLTTSPPPPSPRSSPVSRVSRAEVALGVPEVDDTPAVVETPKPAPAPSKKAPAKPAESEESSE